MAKIHELNRIRITDYGFFFRFILMSANTLKFYRISNNSEENKRMQLKLNLL